jgi:two-component system, response regulator
MSDNALMHLLLVEDEVTHARLFERNIAKLDEDIIVSYVKDGHSALAFACEFVKDAGKPPLIIVLDLNIPGYNGLTVLEKMKTDSTLSAIPVIVLTTSDEPAEVEKCKALGCAAYMIKPIDYTQLQSTLLSLVGR